MSESRQAHEAPRSALHGATLKGSRPSRSHDFYLLGGEDDRVALLGREIRGDWPEQDTEGTEAPISAFAKIAVSFLPLGDGDAPTLKKRFDEGIRRVLREFQQDLQQPGDAPAVALTLAHRHGPHLYVGHVGDGRCYVVTEHGLTRITNDQTLTPQPPDRPVVSDPALSRKLTSVVGGFSDDLVVQTEQVELSPRSVVLLCSAGVARALPDDSLERVVLERLDGSMEAVCNAVLDATGRTLDEADRTVVAARFD